MKPKLFLDSSIFPYVIKTYSNGIIAILKDAKKKTTKTWQQALIFYRTPKECAKQFSSLFWSISFIILLNFFHYVKALHIDALSHLIIWFNNFNFNIET